MPVSYLSYLENNGIVFKQFNCHLKKNSVVSLLYSVVCSIVKSDKQKHELCMEQSFLTYTGSAVEISSENL